MTTHADRPRVPAGINAGGQFAAESRAEADVALSPPSSAGQDLLGRIEAAENRVSALYDQGLGANAGPLRVAATAACVRLAHPGAVAFEVQGCDDDDVLYVGSVFYADGTSSPADLPDELYGHAEGVALRYSTDGWLIEERGSRFTIDEVIGDLDEPTTPQDGKGAELTLARFRAEHLPLDGTDRDTVRALLADLQVWAQRNDIDLAAEFTSATGVLLADDVESRCAACGRTETNGECPVHGAG